MDAQVDVAGLVRETRKRFGLTQQQLASKLHVALPTVSRWENRRCGASPLALDKLQMFLLEMGDEGRKLARQYFGDGAGG